MHEFILGVLIVIALYALIVSIGGLFFYLHDKGTQEREYFELAGAGLFVVLCAASIYFIGAEVLEFMDKTI